MARCQASNQISLENLSSRLSLECGDPTQACLVPQMGFAPAGCCHTDYVREKTPSTLDHPPTGSLSCLLKWPAETVLSRKSSSNSPLIQPLPALTFPGGLVLCGGGWVWLGDLQKRLAPARPQLPGILPAVIRSAAHSRRWQPLAHAALMALCLPRRGGEYARRYEPRRSEMQVRRLMGSQGVGPAMMCPVGGAIASWSGWG